MFGFAKESKRKLLDEKDCLKGRNKPTFDVPEFHKSENLKQNGTISPFPKDLKMAVFGMGCFWGAEQRFYSLDGVYSTNVGFAGGFTPNPTYKEVCTGKTNHAEVVRVIYDDKKISYWQLLNTFWSEHDPTTLCQQGNDIGTQYRSCIYYFDEDQKKEALLSRDEFQKLLKNNITTEIAPIKTFYYAEDYHQQYMVDNKNGYCGLQPNGFNLPEKDKLLNKKKDEEKDA